MRRFKHHQKAAWKYAAPRDSIALFMAMRTGKTLVFIRWAKKKARGGPVLVITPATTIHVWQKELVLEGVKSVALVGSSKAKLNTLAASKHVDGGPQFFITNPEGLRACPQLARELDWAVVGCDETGGWLTNPRAKVSKTLRKTLGRVPHKAILTGLPDPNGPEGYVEQCLFAFNRFMGHDNFWSWRDVFMWPAFVGGMELKPGVRKRIRSAVRKLAFRLTAKQAGLSIPKVHHIRELDPPPEIRKAFKEVAGDFSCGEVETKTAAVAHVWLRRIAGGQIPGGRFNPYKVAEVVKLLTTELKGQRTVIFASFISEIKTLHAALQKAGVKAARITGLTKAKFRPGILSRFESGEVDVTIIQSSVGRYALNLSFASVIIFFSNSEDWDIRSQCQVRCDHMDKKEPVLIVDVVARKTLDSSILKVLGGKRRSSAYFARAVETDAQREGVLK